MDPERNIPDDWQPLRDDEGNVVTLTQEQYKAIWRALTVVENVRRAEGYPSLWGDNAYANIIKSRLLGRILLQGKPPTVTKPPKEQGGPAWWALGGTEYRGRHEGCDAFWPHSHGGKDPWDD